MPKFWKCHSCSSRSTIFCDKSVAFLLGAVDIVGSLPLATGQQKFMLVATDYFTKWAEVEAYT